MTETRVKTESQAYWESDKNLDAACQWVIENFGFKEECFIIFAGQNKRDFQSFITAVKQGHNRATIVFDKLDQSENVWLNNIKQKILDSGDNKAIATMYKFFDQRNRREEKKEKRKKSNKNF